MPKLRIDSVHTKNAVYPMIINFQNGYTTNGFKTGTCAVFTNEESEIKTVATEISGIIYSGEEINEDLGKTLLLARNKTTGKVRLIEVGRAELKPMLKFNSEKSDLIETNNLELSRKFGSKKQKQQMEHREKLKVSNQTVREQMQNVTENITEEKLDLSLYNKSDSDDFYIPPIDRNAEKPEDVYDINKILTEDEFEKIHSELDGKDYISDMKPFIKNIVSKKTLSMKHTVLAVYANTLLSLYSLLMKDLGKKSFVACPHSVTLNEIVLSNFSTMNNGRRARPSPYKDKALCYAIVLILLINNLKFELESFCQDMKLTANNASLKIRVTGASVVTSGSKKVVQLKIPLNSKTGFRRRKSAKF